MAIEIDIFEIIYMLTIQLCQNHLLKMLYCFHCIILASLSKNQVFICVWINVRELNLIPLVHKSVFMLVSSCFYYYSSIVELKVRDGYAFRISFIVQDFFSYAGFLFINMKLNIALLSSLKHYVEIMMGIAVTL